MVIADDTCCHILERLAERVMTSWLRTQSRCFLGKPLDTINWWLRDSMHTVRGGKRTAYVTAQIRDVNKRITGKIQFKGANNNGSFLKDDPVVYVDINGRDDEGHKWQTVHERFNIKKDDAVALALGATPEGLVDSIVRYIQRGH